MFPPITYLRVFIASLLLSLAWHYYTSAYFIDFLGNILLVSAVTFLGLYFLRRFRPTAFQSPSGTGPHFAFWNTATFLSLVFAAELISFIQFQFTFQQFLLRQCLYCVAYGCALFCLRTVAQALRSSLFQIPILLCSFVLVYEIYLTTTEPNPNQTTQLAPIMEGSYICYGGGNGRIINTHYGIPQRRYLAPFVPGAQHFRPPEQNDQESRIAHDFGTAILAPVDGIVISAIDTLPDLPAGTIDDSHPPGNHLCIQMDTNRFLYLANFQQGSMTVRPGDPVQIGQALGKIGKNGSFTESALVVLLVDHPNVIDPNTRSLPYYFRNTDGSLQFPKRNALINPQ